MAQQIQLRNDSTANWSFVNPVLAQGEIGVDTTLGQFKIGDGTSTWNELTFYADTTDELIFQEDGSIDFPTLSSNARTGNGQTLKFSQSNEQVIIVGPETNVGNPTAQRLVVAGSDGFTGTSGEGGDIYLWAGRGGSANGSGGDIKVDAGNGGGDSGGGGTVKVRGGYSEANTGGFLELSAGDSYNGNGGSININAGDNLHSNESNGGDVTIRGGSSADSLLGGSIDLTTYQSGKITLSGAGGEFLNDSSNPNNQIATIGDISGGANLIVPVTIDDSNGDDFITFTRTSVGTARIETPQDDLSLRSARDITLFAGTEGPGNVYIGWGDAVYTPDSPNRVATIGDIQSGTTGDITFDGIQIIGGGAASSDGLGNGTIRLVPDADLTTDQYLIVEPTWGTPGHLHLRTGGTIDESTADLLLGGERTKIQISDSERGILVTTRPNAIVNTYLNTNPENGLIFVTGSTAEIQTGDTVNIDGTTYTVDSVTSGDGVLNVTAAPSAIFAAGVSYTFTNEPTYDNQWLFESSGVLYGPAMGGLRVTAIENSAQGNNLGIYATDADLNLSATNDVSISTTNGDIFIHPDSGAYIGNSAVPENQIATLGDFAYTRVNVPTTSLGQAGDIAHYVADDTSHHYFCTGTYDGTTHIWKRIAWSADQWGV